MRRLAAALLAALLPVAAAAQEDTRLRVAFVDLPPYATHSGNGVWLGYAVEAWRIVAEKNGWTYDVTPLDLAAAEAALARGDIDVALPVPATVALERAATLALPLHTSTMGVAAARETIVLSVLKALLSPVFLKLSAGLSVLLLAVGALVWLVERKRNPGQFAPKVLPGLGDGFWFAGVTLSTIGYGDKTPVTVAGRLIAMLWMLVGVVVTAALTATIVTIAGGSLTDDGTLRSGTIGAVADSATAAYLRADGREVTTFPTLAEAVAALEAGKVDQVAALAPALRDAVAEVAIPLAVQETDRDPVQMTIALRTGSPLIEALNIAILDFNASDGSRRLRAQYLSGD
jgi:polar amino acid transport system substrate-binding protein